VAFRTQCSGGRSVSPRRIVTMACDGVKHLPTLSPAQVYVLARSD
jgi:hypothetical protein